MKILQAIADEVRAAVRDDGHHVLVLRLTIVLLMLYGANSPELAVPLRICGGLMLVVPSLLTFGPLWWCLVVSLVLGNWLDWYSIDNHKYLIGYWTLACALTVRRPTGALHMSRTAQLLIGVVFSLATFWKVLAGEYLDGRFLYFTFLTDGRLHRLGAALTGTPLEDLTALREAITFLGSRGLEAVSITLVPSNTLHLTALAMSWLALVLEGGIGLAHLIPDPRLYAVRHFGVMAFVLMTYYLLPVFPFAFVLILLGLVQCAPTDVTMKLRYLALLAVMHLTLVPWKELFLRTV